MRHTQLFCFSASYRFLPCSEPLRLFVSVLSNTTFILFIGFGTGCETADGGCDQFALLPDPLSTATFRDLMAQLFINEN